MFLYNNTNEPNFTTFYNKNNKCIRIEFLNNIYWRFMVDKVLNHIDFSTLGKYDDYKFCVSSEINPIDDYEMVLHIRCTYNDNGKECKRMHRSSYKVNDDVQLTNFEKLGLDITKQFEDFLRYIEGKEVIYNEQ